MLEDEYIRRLNETETAKMENRESLRLKFNRGGL
jgi:hypothetical protein